MVIDADVALLAEIEPEAERLLERHFTSTKDWHPHLLVPWSRGRDFEPAYEWDPSETNIPADVRAALFVNLLTEDNLPYYFRDIERMLGRDGAFGEWTMVDLDGLPEGAGGAVSWPGGRSAWWPPGPAGNCGQPVRRIRRSTTRLSAAWWTGGWNCES